LEPQVLLLVLQHRSTEAYFYARISGKSINYTKNI
jgi:hypothetical protein